jgi:hypothetical protein
LINIIKNVVNSIRDLKMTNLSEGSTCTINGKTYKGKNITITNNQVIVDGKVQDGSDITGDIKVEVHGDVGSISTTSGDVTARNVGEINTSSGDVECGDVSGSIMTSSGDVECGAIGGNVRTSSGDIKHR